MNGGIEQRSDGDRQRDPSADDLEQFRPGDGPEARSRSMPAHRKRNTDARWGVILGEAL